MSFESTRRDVLTGMLSAASLLAAPKTVTRTLRLRLRTRVEAFKGSGLWQEVHLEKEFPIAETALLICDMWDNHWCSGAARRVNALAQAMNPVVNQARAGGIRIIHAPRT